MARQQQTAHGLTSLGWPAQSAIKPGCLLAENTDGTYWLALRGYADGWST